MSSSTLRRSAVAAIVAILSLVLISAGTATAARLITGKDVKNSSLTGKDIKNKSVGAKDLSADVMASLNAAAGPAGPAGAVGPAGPAGAVGPAGAAGPAGPAVLTDVYAASAPVKGLPNGELEVILDKVLPAGKPYLFTAKLNLQTTGIGQHLCELRSGPDVIDSVTISTTAANSRNEIVMTGVTSSSGLARVSCVVTGGNGVAQQVRLIAIPVANIG